MSQGSWNAFAGPQHLELRPSRALALLVWLPHLLAAALVPGLAVPFWVAALVIILTALSLWRTHCRELRRSGAYGVQAVEWRSDGRWRLRLASGWREAELVLPIYEQPFLVVLPFRLEGRRRTLGVVILPDMTDADNFRRLRVRLRVTVPVRRPWRAGRGADEG